jgi:hypothetical protein
VPVDVRRRVGGKGAGVGRSGVGSSARRGGSGQDVVMTPGAARCPRSNAFGQGESIALEHLQVRARRLRKINVWSEKWSEQWFRVNSRRPGNPGKSAKCHMTCHMTFEWTHVLSPCLHCVRNDLRRLENPSASMVGALGQRAARSPFARTGAVALGRACAGPAREQRILRHGERRCFQQHPSRRRGRERSAHALNYGSEPGRRRRSPSRHSSRRLKR